MASKRRGIPRLVQTGKSERETNGVLKSRERNSVSDHSDTEVPRAFKPPSRAKHFIQGPFNPDIVGIKERRAEEKRKRNEIEAKSASQFLANVGEELRHTKRNPSGEEKKMKTKCKIEFSTKADTAFGVGPNTEEGQTLHFSAKGNVSPRRSQRLHETKKNEEKRPVLPVKRTGYKPQNVEKLTTQLDTANERVKQLEDELESLKNRLSEKDATYSDALETQAHNYSKKTRDLQQQVEQCMQKLQQCNIDPVTLKSLDPDDEEKENLELTRQESVALASKLREQLEGMNEQSIKEITGIKLMLAEAADVQVVPSSPKVDGKNDAS